MSVAIVSFEEYALNRAELLLKAGIIAYIVVRLSTFLFDKHKKSK